MRLLLIIHTGADERRVPALLEAHDVGGCTRLESVHGSGATGRHEGTRAWPGDSTLYMTVVRDEQVEPLRAAVRAEAARLPAAERLHIGVMPLESFD
jgi:hypothetical protein